MIEPRSLPSAFLRAVAAHPVLSGQLVQLARLHPTGDEVVYLARHAGREPFGSSADTGDQRPARTTAVGVAALSRLADAEIAARYEDSSVEILDRVWAARWAGHAIDRGSTHPSIFGLAVALPEPFPPGLSVGVSLVEVQGEQVTAGDDRYTLVTTSLGEIAAALVSASAAA